MLLTCYLTTATLFYYWVVRRAPVIEEPNLATAAPPATCEVIELFPATAELAERKAA